MGIGAGAGAAMGGVGAAGTAPPPPPHPVTGSTDSVATDAMDQKRQLICGARLASDEESRQIRENSISTITRHGTGWSAGRAGPPLNLSNQAPRVDGVATGLCAVAAVLGTHPARLPCS